MKAYEFAARRKRLNVPQREVEIHFRLPAGALGGIEDGRLRVVDEQVDELNAYLDNVEREQAKEEACAA